MAPGLYEGRNWHCFATSAFNSRGVSPDRKFMLFAQLARSPNTRYLPCPKQKRKRKGRKQNLGPTRSPAGARCAPKGGAKRYCRTSTAEDRATSQSPHLIAISPAPQLFQRRIRQIAALLRPHTQVVTRGPRIRASSDPKGPRCVWRALQSPCLRTTTSGHPSASRKRW